MSPDPGSFSEEKVAFRAAWIAAARSCESPGEERHEMTLPERFTRIVTVIVPSVPARLALEGYSAAGTLMAAFASVSLTTGAFGSAFGAFVALLESVSVGAGDVVVADCGGRSA